MRPSRRQPLAGVAFPASPKFCVKIGILEKPNLDDEDDAAAAMAKLGAMSKALSSDPARKRVLEDVAEATGGVDAMVDMLSNVSLGTSLGAAAATPAGQPRISRGEIQDMVVAARPVLRQAFSPMVVPATAKLYKALSTQELKRYRWCRRWAARRATRCWVRSTTLCRRRPLRSVPGSPRT